MTVFLGEGRVVGRDSFIAVYMMANRRHGTLYIGVTSSLITRAMQHRDGALRGFTARYGLKRLVWYGPFELMTNAIHREKRLKKYRRDWKINLIEFQNPHWDDLLPGLLGWRPDNPWGQPRP
ncbi:MAG: GIY-YIG nuclease family protein [Caulobacter sp.]